MRPSILVDRLGQVRAKIADLQTQEKALKAAIVRSGKTEVDGQLFHAAIIRMEQTCVDYKGLIARLKPNPRLLKRFTTATEVVQVRVSARLTN